MTTVITEVLNLEKIRVEPTLEKIRVELALEEIRVELVLEEMLDLVKKYGRALVIPKLKLKLHRN